MAHSFKTGRHGRSRLPGVLNPARGRRRAYLVVMSLRGGVWSPLPARPPDPEPGVLAPGVTVLVSPMGVFPCPLLIL